MPHLTLPLSRAGAVLDVQLGVGLPRATALRAGGLTVPPTVGLRAMIDTGARYTCVTPEVLQRLGLTPVGTTRIRTPSSGAAGHARRLFEVSVTVQTAPPQVLAGAIHVIETSLTGHGIASLIGHDLLTGRLFVYDGAAGSFCAGGSSIGDLTPGRATWWRP